MQKHTHVAAGVAASIIILNPSTIGLTVITALGATLGSLIPDIDISTSESHKDLTIITVISLLGILATIIVDLIYHLGIISLFQNDINLLKILIAIICFLLLSAHGLHSEHRTFTHSILGVTLFSTCIYFIFKQAFYPFFIGGLFHIVLDLSNMKKVQIFYPFKFKFCLNLFESNGKANKIISIISIFLILIKEFI